MSRNSADEVAALKDLVRDLNDVVDSYDPSSGLPGRLAIIDKTKKISQLMMDPNDMSTLHSVNMTELVAIRTFLKFQVLEKIPDPGSISLPDLSKATGMQESLLDRMLRLVVGTGFLDQTPEYQYTHTKFSRGYIIAPGPGSFFQAMYDEYLKTMCTFDDYLVSRKSLTEPTSPSYNPYTLRHAQDGIPFWEIMSQSAERIQAFQLGFANQETSVPVAGFYDFGALATDDPDRHSLVDVGGGQGQSIAEILAAHPMTLRASKMVLQDLPEPIAQARYSAALSPQVLKMEHDFFTPQPIRGAKAYYLRRITRDYADADNVTILSHLRNAMAPDSKVLIADVVLPRRAGEAELAATAMDCIGMAFGGKERTEEGFRALLEQAGLVLVKVWRAADGAGALVEAKLR